MGAIELAFALLFGAVLGGLAASGRGPKLPAWADLFAPGAMAWLCGVQGSLFQRQADYMVAYLVEARGHPVAWYAVWSLGCVSLTLLGSRMVQSVKTVGLPAARGRIAILMGMILVGCSGLLWPRLVVFGSTLEFAMGIARPLSTQPAVRILLGISLLATVIPVGGAVLVVAIDALRARRRGAGATAP